MYISAESRTLINQLSQSPAIQLWEDGVHSRYFRLLKIFNIALKGPKYCQVLGRSVGHAVLNLCFEAATAVYRFQKNIHFKNY